uniref:Uncharacterized protein n=1 Tax=Anguilla anguilla TaxID=7936 RepID=A0A0E9P5K7_ANGAN
MKTSNCVCPCLHAFFSVYCGCNQYQLNSHVINRTLLKFCCAQQNQFGSVIQFPSSISRQRDNQ